jgi:hypothetical protein
MRESYRPKRTEEKAQRKMLEAQQARKREQKNSCVGVNQQKPEAELYDGRRSEE